MSDPKNKRWREDSKGSEVSGGPVRRDFHVIEKYKGSGNILQNLSQPVGIVPECLGIQTKTEITVTSTVVQTLEVGILTKTNNK